MVNIIIYFIACFTICIGTNLWLLHVLVFPTLGSGPLQVVKRGMSVEIIEQRNNTLLVRKIIFLFCDFSLIFASFRLGA